jgi:hypothetical protein
MTVADTCGWNGCREPKADGEDRCEDHEWSQCRTEDCDGDADCGDSYDGYCPSCADERYESEGDDMS